MYSLYYCTIAKEGIRPGRSLLTEKIRNSLKHNWEFLIDNIRYDYISDWMYGHHVISKKHLEFIEEVKTNNSSMIRRLIDILSRRSMKEYRMFLTCLKTCHHPHVADLLENGGG
jgi:Caspase recruitment domain